MSRADLTLPGTIPGLLRRGSPVVVTEIPVAAGPTEPVFGGPRRLAVGDQCTVTDEPRGAFGWLIVAGETNDDEGPPWAELPSRAVALDLSEATGTAHAAWWADSRLDDEAVAERFTPTDADRARVRHLLRIAGRGPVAAMVDEERTALRDLCLRLAEVSP